MADIKTDSGLAQSILTGQPYTPPENPEEPIEPIEPKEPGEPTEPVEPVEPTEPTDDNNPVEPTEPTEPTEPVEPVEPKEPEEPSFSIDDIKEEQLIELINKNFNVKFDTKDAAKEFFDKQVSYRGQEKLIEQLIGKVKENSNVLSHYPTEKAYKIAKLAEEYPGKETSIAKIVNSDVNALSDLDAIRLNEEFKRGPNSRVDPLRTKLRALGLSELDISDFDNWDIEDKEVLYDAADEAKAKLSEVAGKVQMPKDGETPELDDFIKEYERGVQSETEAYNAKVTENTPVAEEIVETLQKIPFGENGEFEYEVQLDSESKKELVDFLIGESIEGNYDVKSSQGKELLKKMLEQEIWATDGQKIAEAYAAHMVAKAKEEEAAKYENRAPLKDEKPEKGSPKEETDSDRAKRLLQGR